MTDAHVPVWIAFGAALGLAVGHGLHQVIQRLPVRMAAAWRREALDMLELELDDDATPAIPAAIAPSRSLPIMLVTAVASAVVVGKFGPSEAALAGLALTWTLIVLAGIDARTHLLPDQFTLPLLWLGLLLALKPLFVATPAAILGAAIGYGCLWCVGWGCKLLTGQEGMGFGDLKLLAALGAWMGPVALLPIGLLASALSIAVSGVQILQRRQARSEPFPFGPYLALAGWIWFLAGGTLWSLMQSVIQRS